MSQLYRGALIGCGYASWFQLTAWSRIEDVEIVAVASRSRENGQRRATEFEIPAVYTDYQAMLDREELDFVDIATPPTVHLEMVSEAARRNLHVLCQKPAASTLGELQMMIHICDEAGVVFVVNENGRFQPYFRKMKTLLNEGAIGRPHYANFTTRARSTLPLLDGGEQHNLFVNMPRLIVYEMGVHYLDTLRYLFGEPTSIYAQTHQASPHVKGEDVAALTVKFGELTAVVDMSWASVPIMEMESDEHYSWGEYRIEGEIGTLHLRPDALLRLLTDDGEEQFQFPPHSSGVVCYQAAQQHFVDCLRTGAKSETSGLQTAKTMELVFGAYDSAAHNRVYRVGDDLGRLK